MEQDLVAPVNLQLPQRTSVGNGIPDSPGQNNGHDTSARLNPSQPFRSRLTAAFEGERYD
jgi:hypothetical protein